MKIRVVKVIYGGVIPDFGLFNMRMEAAHAVGIAWSYVILAVVWGAVYSIGVVALASLLFNRRDLK